MITGELKSRTDRVWDTFWYVYAEKRAVNEAERALVNRALETSDELFAALQHRAFHGEL